MAQSRKARPFRFICLYCDQALPEDYLDTMGKRLKHLRQQKNLNLRALSNAVDISASFLRRIELDQTDVCVSRIEKLADYFEVTLDYLMRGAHG